MIQLSDFGFAMVSGIQHKNMKMSGTLGYVAPEYISHGMPCYIVAPFLNQVVVVLVLP